MEVKRIKDNYYKFQFIENDKVFNVFFGGNLDLYFELYSCKRKNNLVDTFEVTKENYQVYLLFDKLYESIKNHDIYKALSMDKEEKERAILENEELGKSLAYSSIYNDGVISWYSDEKSEEEANLLEIFKEEDKYILKFSIKEDNNAIRFRNSRSRYKPFNLAFMDFFNDLINCDLEDRQIHMEEYLYKMKVKKL